MTRPTRPLLAGLVALSLLFAACGGDDDDASDVTTTTEDDNATDDGATDDGGTDDDATPDVDVCGLVDLDALNAATGETFTTSEQTEADTCQVTDDAQTALFQLSVKLLEDGETDESFVEDGRSACDEGTEDSDVDLGFADAGFACEISGQAAVAVVLDGGAALVIGHPSDPSVTSAQMYGALSQIVEGIVSR